MACRFTAGLIISFLVCSAALGADVSVSGGPPVISQADCRALATYQPGAGGVKGPDYQPGVDVNGHAVAPADLPGGSTYQLPAKVEFNIAINPISYGTRNANGTQNTASTGTYANTAMNVGHVVVDTRTGAVTLDGKPITGDNEQYLTDLCRKAGY